MNRFDEDLSEIFSRLWQLDANACEPGRDYVLNVQKKASGQQDLSSEKLFTKFDERVLTRPTYAAFCKLLDNYEADTNSPEVETLEEKQEVHDFLTAILRTRVMKEAHAYLTKKGKSSIDENVFRKQLHDIWFRLYKRNASEKEVNSCGFEHVFVGEIRGDEVIGFHNWINLYLQEKIGALNYYGYYDDDKPRTKGKHLELLTFQFSWKNVLKQRSSSLFGTSPEFEMAMYTIAFLSQKSELAVAIEGSPLRLKIYHHGRGIGSAYPKRFAK